MQALACGVQRVEDRDPIDITPRKSARLTSLIPKSGQQNIKLHEEDLDLTILERKAMQRQRGGELLRLRSKASYGILPRAEMEKKMDENPEAHKVVAQWVHLEEKSRLIALGYPKECVAATGHPMGERVIPTIAVKRDYNTMTINVVRDHVELPEDAEVYVEPPPEWQHEPDYIADSVWVARTTWYGERGASRPPQEFITNHLLGLGAVRGTSDPTKFLVRPRVVHRGACRGRARLRQ